MDQRIVIKLNEKTPDYRISNESFGFVRTVAEAYTRNDGITIRPDDIWINILSQLALYVSYNRDSLSKKVKLPSNVVLDKFPIIKVLDFVKEYNNIIKYKNDSLLKWMTIEFSTSQDEDQFIKSVMLSGQLSKYSYYNPNIKSSNLVDIEILGTITDWKKIYENLDKILDFKVEHSNYNLEDWFLELKLFIDEFIKAKKGYIDVNYWSKFIYINKNIKEPHICGQIIKLCQFYERNNKLEQLKVDYIMSKDIHNESVVLPIKDDDKTRVVAGNIGYCYYKERLSCISNINIVADYYNHVNNRTVGFESNYIKYRLHNI